MGDSLAVLRNRAKKRAIVQRIKQERGCKTCGFKDNPLSLNFHHRDPATKFDKVSNMLTYSLEKIMEEIGKCDVLCTGCHEAVHYS